MAEAGPLHGSSLWAERVSSSLATYLAAVVGRASPPSPPPGLSAGTEKGKMAHSVSTPSSPELYFSSDVHQGLLAHIHLFLWGAGQGWGAAIPTGFADASRGRDGDLGRRALSCRIPSTTQAIPPRLFTWGSSHRTEESCGL